jgi:hypothetical protein
MRHTWCGVAVVGIVCTLSACLNGGPPGEPGEVCYVCCGTVNCGSDHWRVSFLADQVYEIEVGASERWAIWPDVCAAQCNGQVASVEWMASNPGVVSLTPTEPSDNPRTGDPRTSILITGEAPGETRILARVTLHDGVVARSAPSFDPLVRVVPAS